MKSSNTSSTLSTDPHRPNELSPGLLQWAACALLIAGLASPSSLHGQSLYWDGNDVTTGAGSTPAGIWGTDLFWSIDPSGEAVTAAWTAGSLAVFSAGTDASGPFTVTIAGTQIASGMVVDEGAVNLATGSVSVGAGSVSVNAGAALVTDSSLRIAATAGATLTLNGGELRTTNPGAAGTFIDTDFAITLGEAGGIFSHTTPNVLNIVQTATVVSGPGSLTKTGVGVLAIAGTCSYAGGTTIDDGELRIRSAANRLPIATPVIVNSPGILNLNGVSQQVGSLSGDGTVGLGSGTLTVGDATDTVFTGSISNIANAGASGVTTGSGRVSKQGSGSLTFMGTNAFTGSLTNNAGTIIVAPGAILCDPLADLVVNGGDLVLSNVAQTVLSLSGTGGTINLTAGHTLTVNPTGVRTYSGSVVGPGELIKTGTGTLGLAGNNSYDGTTFVNAGELSISSATALGSTIGGTEVASGAELLFEGAATVLTIDEPLRIAGPGSSDGGAITVQASANVTISGSVILTGDTTNTVSSTATVLYNNPNAITALSDQNLTLQGGSGAGGGGTISGVISLGSGGLTKQQSGRWTLSGANVYSGPTLVNAGTLRIANTTGSATGIGEVTVNAGATVSGAGSIAGTININGTIAPGASPGTLNSGNEVWNGGGTYAWEMNDVDAGQGSDPGWDLIDITGTLTINATAEGKFNIDLRSLDPANAAGNVADFDNTSDYEWTILRTTGGISGFDAAAFNLLTSGFSNPLGTGSFLIDTANGGNDLVIRFVHPPAIALQPADQSAECATGTATFSVMATGTAPLTYQWRLNGANIEGATAATLVIDPTTSDTAGAYDVVVANSYGTVTSAAAALTVVDTTAPIISTCAPDQSVAAGEDCMSAIPALTGAVTASDACGPVVVSQSPVAGTLVGVGVHTVTITVTDGANLTATCSATVTVVDQTPPTISQCAEDQGITAGADCLAAIPDLTGAVTATDLCSVVTISQNPAAGTMVPVGLHIVTITATDAANNSATCLAEVTVNPSFTLSVNSVTNCVPGTVVLTATSSAANSTYAWSPGGETTASITVSPISTTEYTVTVTDVDTTCSLTATGTVAIAEVFTVSVDSQTICEGSSATLTAITDAVNPSYLWSPGGETTASITVTPSETTTYTVMVADQETECTVSASGTVTVNPLPIVTVNSETICAGASATLSATTPAANPIYLWSPGGQTTASISVSPTETTVYSVMVTDGVTTCVGAGSGTVTVIPVHFVSVNSETICVGNSATLTATTDASDPTYLWSPGGETTASITVSPTEMAVYTVTVTDGTTACSVTVSGTVTVNPLPTVTVSSSTICVGDSVLLTATTSADNPTYLWSPGGETTASITVSPTETTTYTVTVTDGTTTCVGTGTGTATVVPPPTLTLNSETICAGGSATLTATTEAADPTYLWSPGGETTASITVSPAETTVYMVTVTDGATTCAAAGSGTVTVNQLPTVTVNSPTICVGDSVLLTATTSAVNPTYLWSPGGETTASITVSPVETTTYTVTVTDGTTSCAATGSGTVTLNPPQVFANANSISINDNAAGSPYPSVIPVSGLTSTVCRVTVTLHGLSHAFPDDIDLVLVGPDGQGVLLMSDVGGGNAINNVTLTFDDLAAGSLPDSGAIATGTFKPTNIGAKIDGLNDIFPLPAPQVQFTTNLSSFDGIDPNGDWSLYVVDDETVDSGSIIGGWSIAIRTASPFADVSVTQSAHPNPVAVGSNLTYTVTVSNAGPATASDVVLSDTLPAGATFVSATSEAGACAHLAGIVTCQIGSLNPGSGIIVTIVVAPGAAGTLENVASASSTTLDFDTGNNSSSASFTALEPPVITLQPISEIFCAGETLSFAVTATGAEPLSYQWFRDDVVIDGAVGSTLVILNAQPSDSGNYTVLVNNSVGTAISDVAVATVNPNPVVTVNSETICPGGSAILTALHDAANPAFLWSPSGETTASITVSPGSTTTYSVLVTDGDTGCFASASGTVTVEDTTAPIIICPEDILVSCEGVDLPTVNFTVTATDNCDESPLVTVTPPSGSVFPAGTNLVTVLATDAAGNTSTCTFTVTVLDPIDPVLSIARVGDDVVISWPQSCTVYALEETAGFGDPTVWTEVTGSIETVGTNYQITVSAISGNKFYRLKKQP